MRLTDTFNSIAKAVFTQMAMKLLDMRGVRIRSAPLREHPYL